MIVRINDSSGDCKAFAMKSDAPSRSALSVTIIVEFVFVIVGCDKLKVKVDAAGDFDEIKFSYLQRCLLVITHLV